MIYCIKAELLHFAKGPGCKNLSHPMNGSTVFWKHLQMRLKQSNGHSCSCTSQQCQLFHLQSFCAGGLGGLVNLHKVLMMLMDNCCVRANSNCQDMQDDYHFFLIPCCSCSLWNSPFSTYRDPKLIPPNTVQSGSVNQTNLLLSSELSTGKSWHAALLQGVHSLSFQVPEFLNQE